MSQQHTPLFTALKHHKIKQPVSFHVPGHKYGETFPHQAREEYQNILKIDATELTGLDDLHDAATVIQDAQSLLADLYGVKKSFFLINGSTVGNLAMILSVCDRNDIVLVQRNCHKSILNGLEIAGASPVFLAPEFDECVGVPTYISYESIKAAIERYPSAKALILTNPNYYGIAIDLTEIIELAHQFGIPVLVDEAHGAHFIIGSPFPKSANQCGADIVVNSAHKTLPAMTMGSYLHFNSKLVNLDLLRHYLHALQSSSPSYPIMASLDIARHYLANLDNEKIKILEKEIILFKNSLKKINQIEVVETKDPAVTTDLLKITLQTRCSLSGYELQALFESQNIYTELADPYNVLLVLPLATGQKYQHIIEILESSLKPFEIKEEPKKLNPVVSKYSTLPICYKDVKRYNKKVINLSDSVGMLASHMIVPYPPGIPLVMIGERITKDHLEQIKVLLQLGAKIQGIIDKEYIEAFVISKGE